MKRSLCFASCWLLVASSSLAASGVLPEATVPAMDTVQLLEGGQPVKIACFGDSVTGVYYHTGNRRAWCDLAGLALRRLYPRAQIEMINAGISGNSSADGLQRMEADVLHYQPQLVVAMFGLNDVVRVPPEDFRANLRTIVERSRRAGAEVILMTPNFVSDEDPARTLLKVTAYAQITREVGREMNVPVTDVFQALRSIHASDYLAWRRLMSDGVHLNMRGHKLVAEAVIKTLTGRQVSLADLPRLQPGLPRVLAKLQATETVHVLAMKPYDVLIVPALRHLFPEARIEVTAWDAASKSLAEIEAEAKAQGWPKYREHPDLTQPDLVVLAVPADAAAADKAQFIQCYTWIMNWSLSFTPPGWNCLVILPSVALPAQDASQRAAEKFALDVIQGQDLPWLQRTPGDQAPAPELLERKLAELLETPKP